MRCTAHKLGKKNFLYTIIRNVGSVIVAAYMCYVLLFHTCFRCGFPLGENIPKLIRTELPERYTFWSWFNLSIFQFSQNWNWTTSLHSLSFFLFFGKHQVDYTNWSSGMSILSKCSRNQMQTHLNQCTSLSLSTIISKISCFFSTFLSMFPCSAIDAGCNLILKP